MTAAHPQLVRWQERLQLVQQLTRSWSNDKRDCNWCSSSPAAGQMTRETATGAAAHLQMQLVQVRWHKRMQLEQQLTCRCSWCRSGDTRGCSWSSSSPEDAAGEVGQVTQENPAGAAAHLQMQLLQAVRWHKRMQLVQQLTCRCSCCRRSGGTRECSWCSSSPADAAVSGGQATQENAAGAAAHLQMQLLQAVRWHKRMQLVQQLRKVVFIQQDARYAPIQHLSNKYIIILIYYILTYISWS